ncbi:MAG: hypothetical protein IPL80_07980 [Sterolibacteriaceae bacterium]|nr:hypothetical protein [Sterolibacteriaceae bacterium]
MAEELSAARCHGRRADDDEFLDVPPYQRAQILVAQCQIGKGLHGHRSDDAAAIVGVGEQGVDDALALGR